MANQIIGTPFDDVLPGTNGDDEIFAQGGNDLINAADGNDVILPGAGDDKVFGGLGDDTIIYDQFGDNEDDQVDGGTGAGFPPGMNTLVTTVLAGDNFLGANNGALTPATVWGSQMLLANIAQVQVSNASVINGNPFILDLSQDDSFGLPEELLAENHYITGMQAMDSTQLHALDYTAATGDVTPGIDFAPSKGVDVFGINIQSTYFLDHALADQAAYQALVDTLSDAEAAEANFDSLVDDLTDARDARDNFGDAGIGLVSVFNDAVTEADEFDGSPPAPGTVDGYDPADPVETLADATQFYADALADAQDTKATFEGLRDAYDNALTGYIPGNLPSEQALADAFDDLRTEEYASPPFDPPANLVENIALGIFNAAGPDGQAVAISNPGFAANTESDLDDSAAGLHTDIVAAQADVDAWAVLADAVQDAWDDIAADPLFAGDPSGDDAVSDIHATQDAHELAVQQARGGVINDDLWVGGAANLANIALTQAAHDAEVAAALSDVDNFLGKLTNAIPDDIPGSLDAFAAEVEGQEDALDGVPTSFPTIGSGTVTPVYDDVAGKWVLEYTAPDKDNLLPIIQLESTVDDGSVVVTGTQDNIDHTTVDFAVDFAYSYGADIDLSGATVGYQINGSLNDNMIMTGDGDDFVRMNGGDNTVVLNGGNNKAFQGPDGVNGNDNVTIAGDGDNEVGAGVGHDQINVVGDGNNTVYGGAGDDGLAILGDGNNKGWGGAGNDNITVSGNGDNIVGGGDGADTFIIDGDGNNTVYGGAGGDVSGVLDGNDIEINGDGNNTVFGGDSAGTTGNFILVRGNGANMVFNGTGNDTVSVENDASQVVDPRAVEIFGGVGNDTFEFVSGSAGTLVIKEGNGIDILFADDLLDDMAIMVDLSAVFGSEAEVIANLNDDVIPGDTVLTIDGVQDSLRFVGYSVNDLITDTDWLIV